LLGVSSALDDANEIYVADGYLNRRVIVFNLKTGSSRRLGRLWQRRSEISTIRKPARSQ
jgi:hypothetical protein